ncbi:MAG: hypothetical protein GF334_13115 [Candidatus Altiarchaeales archaeon]|nr:hypothetical protein [Candidatus Altiarchaeales archaeon]
MSESEDTYSRRGYVCWPKKVGGFSGSWPFGKVSITGEHISLSILFWSHQISKPDIESIEFVSAVSSNKFYYKTIGKLKLCKITPKRDDLPKWLAFIATDKDMEKLKELDYIS